MTEPVWVSAHVFRHDDLDALLSSQVAPLMSGLRADGAVRAFFYLRYWEGGPHVRLRMLTTPGNADAVRTRVTAHLGRHLRDQPSRHPMTPAGYARVAALAAALEARHDYDRHLTPPDTIRFIAYPPEHDTFGHGPSLAAAEHHFCDSTEIALRTLRLPAPRRLSAAMAMTLASLLALPATRPPSGARPRTAPEGTGLASSDRAAAKAAWRRSRHELIAMAHRLRTADPPPTAREPALMWTRALRGLRDRLNALHRDGAFAAASPHPVAYALDRCLHLHLNRMGISLRQEARLRYLAARTVGAPHGDGSTNAAADPTAGQPMPA